jgi:hypothetical protein
VEEVRIGDDPGLVIKGEMRQRQMHHRWVTRR